jgi:hypothetical protein
MVSKHWVWNDPRHTDPVELDHLRQWQEHFDGVTPNPTVELVSAGARLAKEFAADVILGIGGISEKTPSSAFFTFLEFSPLLSKIPADSQLGQVVRYSDGDDLAVSRLYDDSFESSCARRGAVGYDPVGAESRIETPTRG